MEISVKASPGCQDEQWILCFIYLLRPFATNNIWALLVNSVLLFVCVSVRGSEHGSSADRQQHVDSCEVSVVSERHLESLRLLSGS